MNKKEKSQLIKCPNISGNVLNCNIFFYYHSGRIRTLDKEQLRFSIGNQKLLLKDRARKYIRKCIRNLILCRKMDSSIPDHNKIFHTKRFNARIKTVSKSI